MAFEEYTLVSIRTELKEEFGLDANDDILVDRRINKAIKWIIRKRQGLWPWQIKDLSIDVSAGGTGTADFIIDTNTAAKVSGTRTPAIRDIISFDSSTLSLTTGFLVTAFSSPTITFDANFVGATESAKPYSLVTGYYALPSDFQRMRSLYDISILKSQITYRTSEELENIRREQSLAVGTNMVYTVEKDPLVESHVSYSNDLFLLLYPYPAARTTIRGKYVADHQTLSADADVPLLPRNGRDLIVQVASWMLAMTYKETSQVSHYKSVADESMEEMLYNWDYAVDDTQDVSAFGSSIGPVPGPPGFPDWRVR